MLDPIGDKYGPAQCSCCVPAGTLVSLPSPAEDLLVEQARQLGVRAGFLLVEPDHAGLKDVARLADAGRLQIVVDTVLPLEQAAKAHDISETGHTAGKIVLTVT